ncbi:MAG TPA: nitroreductase family protein [Actinomycetota bacterium]
MELEEAIRTQRAIRRLRDEPVDDEVILRCIELATKAPTGSNSQAWEFMVVRDAKVKAALGRQNRIAWSVYARAFYMLTSRNPSRRRIADAVSWQAEHWDEIPVLIVPCLRGISWPVPWLYRASRYGSIYPAVQNLLLAARDAGLGAALTTLPLWNRIAARRALGLPLRVEPVCVVPLGWPRGRYGPTTRKPVGQITHLNRWGNRAFG